MRKVTVAFIILGIFFLSIEIHGQSNHNNSTKNNVIDSIYSKTLNQYRKFWVKFPENYNPKSYKKYPVVYLLDGISLKTSLEAAYNNYWGQYLPHMILVGISNQSNRTRDLTTSEIKTSREVMLKANSGGAQLFTDFIDKELIKHIDKNYPTTTYRTLIGHSYGGLFTINTLINHPNLFTNYLAIDPSLDWDNKNVLKKAKAKLATQSFKGKSLFVSLAAEQLHMFDESVTMSNLMEDTSGFTQFARSIVEFSEFTKSQKQSELNFSWKVYPEDLHGTIPLPSMIDGLVFLFKWYQFKSPQVYNNPETSLKTIEKMLKKQEKIYSEHFGYPVPPMIEEMLIGYGNMNLQMQQPKKAYLFFKTFIDYYPKNANAYSSMSEYYQSQKDNINALKYATKAYKISGSNYHKKRVEELKK